MVGRPYLRLGGDGIFRAGLHGMKVLWGKKDE